MPFIMVARPTASVKITVLGSLQHSVANVFRRLEAWVASVDDANENPLILSATPSLSDTNCRLHQLVFAHFHGAAMAVGESDPIVPERMDGHG